MRCGLPWEVGRPSQNWGKAGSDGRLKKECDDTLLEVWEESWQQSREWSRRRLKGRYF